MTTETKVEVDANGIVTVRRGVREVRGLRPYRGCQVAAVLHAQEVRERETLRGERYGRVVVSTNMLRG